MRSAGAWTRIVSAGFVLAMVMAVAPVSWAQGRGGAAVAGKTAGETGKNIQVLKDLPADQLNPTMRFFAYSLGVECAFCHAGGDQSKDDKPTKLMARTMIKMEMAINKDNFNAQTMVTCYTCHRGSHVPSIQVIETTKIIPGGTAPAAPAPAAGRGGAGRGGPGAAAAVEPEAPALPTADAILAKFVQALGGEQALRKITNRTFTGSLDTAGRNTQDIPWAQGTFELYQKAPNLRVITRAAEGQASDANGFDGTVSWTQSANGAVAEASGIALARAKRAADFYRPLNMRQEYMRMEVRGIEKIGDRDAYLVVGYPNGDTPERLYFDTQSGLLLRRVSVNENMIAEAPIQTDYLDYRDTGGIKYAMTVKTSDVTATPLYTVLRISKVDLTTPIDASKFVKPVSTAPAGGRGGGGRGGAQ